MIHNVEDARIGGAFVTGGSKLISGISGVLRDAGAV